MVEYYGCGAVAMFRLFDSRLGTRDCEDDCNRLKIKKKNILFVGALQRYSRRYQKLGGILLLI